MNYRDKDLKHLQEAVKQQPEQLPSETVRVRVMAVVTAGDPALARQGQGHTRQRLAGIGIAVLVFALLFAVIQPGVALGWRVDGVPPAAYRIYRSPAFHGERALVHEVKAITEESQYQFVDLWVLPAGQYTYTVEGVGGNGQAVASQTITVDASAVMLTQAAILAASVLMGWEAVAVFKALKKPTFMSI